MHGNVISDNDLSSTEFVALIVWLGQRVLAKQFNISCNHLLHKLLPQNTHTHTLFGLLGGKDNVILTLNVTVGSQPSSLLAFEESPSKNSWRGGRGERGGRGG